MQKQFQETALLPINPSRGKIYSPKNIRQWFAKAPLTLTEQLSQLDHSIVGTLMFRRHFRRPWNPPNSITGYIVILVEIWVSFNCHRHFPWVSSLEIISKIFQCASLNRYRKKLWTKIFYGQHKLESLILLANMTKSCLIWQHCVSMAEACAACSRASTYPSLSERTG